LNDWNNKYERIWKEVVNAEVYKCETTLTNQNWNHKEIKYRVQSLLFKNAKIEGKP
jgi:hypothetical protein